VLATQRGVYGASLAPGISAVHLNCCLEFHIGAFPPQLVSNEEPRHRPPKTQQRFPPCHRTLICGRHARRCLAPRTCSNDSFRYCTTKSRDEYDSCSDLPSRETSGAHQGWDDL